MFTRKELRNLAKKAGFTGSSETKDISTLSKKERLEIIRGDDLDEKNVAAAVEIQRIWKGYKARISISSLVQSRASEKCTIGDGSTFCRSSRLNSSYSIHRDNASLNNIIPLPFKEFCAAVIQRWWKKIMIYETKKKKQKKSMPLFESHQSSFDENFVRNSNVRINLRKTPSDFQISETEAASVIQRSWRRHVDVQVYRYYKDLISFKSIGDPTMMLKCINPRECDLLDSASGSYVRFRLGGTSFPPNVYYKIFTNRNIADIGAFAPRDYTKSQIKKLPMKYVHNKSDKLNDFLTDEQTDWYQRWENNGWRLVSDKMIQHIYQDPVTFTTSKKKSKFHYSKLARKEDVEKRRKQRKIDWMKKMYRDGAANEEDSNVKSLVESAAKGIFNATETGFDSSIEDWEVDELLEWTKGLSFDQYHVDWKEIGTTLSSDVSGVISQ